ncbi:glycosyltransferase family 2 protein [Simiduia agarivorans]|uniref:Glucosyltransferase n=1 Tax=Simiduia agarivorans (strain DSM 21679 / JCM 13881 / BCRC 17597 / SA1) TaxID=1117647 RepID=K4KLA5_SIMAS|nr:glycosyltransferase family 2 protein [Simiduia agarivorans]AFU99796.1 glucosyltransferase [Simiduia agarivorans SA1 = DSM 21679]
MTNALFKPVFSVVMPMYNVEAYVEQAITSVLEQSYPHFELICVDDGSTDSTAEIVSRFNDPRIRYVHQKNRGLAGARNTGIGHSNGLYVAFLDSDDYWHPEKLYRHIEHFRTDPKLGCSYSASLFVDEQGVELGIGQHPKVKNISVKDIFCRNPIGNGSAPVIRRSLLIKTGRKTDFGDHYRMTYFDESLRQSEDIEYWLRLALSTGCKFEGLREGLTYYRVNASGLSANLEKQYAAWELCIEKNRALNPAFFQQWGSLARAYQLRYLARRAVQSGNKQQALKLVVDALKTDKRILKEEPGRTLITLACACLLQLPGSVYRSLEKAGMQYFSQHNKMGKI